MTPPPLVYTIAELASILKCGRHTALRLANELGVRISPRRLVVPRVRLEAWLASGQNLGSDRLPDPKAATLSG